ncbi:MAG: hypothetical protein LC732_09720, partial [Acidobacteria bacterium]|nr:hypothetical protein [Acidobacteriota bacterium]
SLDPSFAAESTVASGTLTVWKRVFVEKRRMLKNGLFLSRAAAAGDTEIYLRGNAYGGNDGKNKMSKGERIVLVHGPQLDGSDTEWYMEEHTILQVEDLGVNDEYRVRLGTKKGKVVTAETLLRPYGPDVLNPAIGDAIAHLSGTTLSPDDVYDAGDDLVTNSVFPEANVEYIVLASSPGSTVPMPFLETSSQPLLQSLADKWSSVVTSKSAVPRALPNHQLLVIASAGAPSWAGVTTHMIPGETSSWVFRRTIESVAKGKKANEDLWCSKTAAHEIAHQWQANRMLFGDLDHCGVDSTAYDDPGLYCLLASYDPNKSETQRGNGIARFHLVPHPDPGTSPFGDWHSEYFEIRRRSDPFRP